MTQEILSHLGLANKVRAAGIVGIIFKNYFYINAEAVEWGEEQERKI